MLRFFLVFALGCVISQVTKAVHIIDKDFRLTDEQWNALHKSSDINERKAVVDAIAWDKGIIPYKISPELSHITPIIEEGLAMWEAVTCMQFPREEQVKSGAYVIFKNLGKGECYSYFGYVHNFAIVGQNISIGDGCETADTVAHEIGHAMGLAHEQHRPDRDNYVIVHYNNMDNESHEQFLSPLNIDTFQIPYDYLSIMHYGIDAFSTTGRLTMVPKDHTMEVFMGNAKKPTYNDIHIVNAMYDCFSLCPNSNLNCQNDGFVTYTTEFGCRCICPDGYTGLHCEKQTEPDYCGEVITQPTTLQPPSFPYRSNRELYCGFHIVAPNNQKVQITFDTFYLERREPQGFCYFDYIKIRIGNLDNDDPGQTYCGNELNNMQVQSTNNEMGLYYKGYGVFRANIEFV